MKITAGKFFRYQKGNAKSKLLGTGHIRFHFDGKDDEYIEIKNFKLFESNEGMSIGIPANSYKENGKWVNGAKSIYIKDNNSSVYNEAKRILIKAYEDECGMSSQTQNNDDTTADDALAMLM